MMPVCFQRSVLPLLLSSLLFWSCEPQGAEPAPPPAERPPTVLISIDTLRSDRLPAYGYTDGSTPAIDALRRDGVLFAHAYSHVPLTLPSHASILTGLLPGEHGVRDNLGYRLERGGLPNVTVLAREAGYATGAAVSSFVLRAETGLDDGFDFYDDAAAERSGAGLGAVQRSGHASLDAALAWLETAPRPFFLFLHLFEPHAPYEPPARHAARFASPYDGEVAAADEVVGHLVERLRELGLYDETAVVLLSDHGEGLNDHGEREHGLFLYREALQVPLVLKLPRGRHAGAAVDAAAQLTDVAPTLAELWGVGPSPRWRGTSLLRAIEASPSAEREIYAETYHPRLQYGWSELTALVRGRFHLIQGPDPELFDLEEDPGETRNVLRQNRRVAAEMRASLEERRSALAAPAASDPETRRRLAALGYVGTGGGEGRPRPGESLLDPKSQLATLDEIRVALQKFEARDFAASAVAFRRLTAAQPGMVQGWELLGASLVELGEREAALEAYRRAFAVSPGSAEAALRVAALLVELERFEEAREHAELALAADGESVAALLLAAEALNRLDRPREALASLERVTVEPEGLHLQRGSAFARLGDAAAAETELSEEIRLFPENTRVYQELAVLYALEGRTAETAATLRGMVESLDSPEAYAAAVATLRILNDPRSAEGLLRRARQRFPESVLLRQRDD